MKRRRCWRIRRRNGREEAPLLELERRTKVNDQEERCKRSSEAHGSPSQPCQRESGQRKLERPLGEVGGMRILPEEGGPMRGEERAEVRKA